MPVSKAVVPLDDVDTIRRFTEEIGRRSRSSVPSLQGQVETFDSTIIQSNSSSQVSQVEHRATQTEPVTITLANGDSQIRNGILAKQKSVLDSVLLQSPPGSGVMAPPTTPENRPGLSNYEISQLIIDNIESLPSTSTFTLGESRHAPRYSSANRGNMRGSSGNGHVSSSMPRGQISLADRNVQKNQSFTRMSFQAADSPSITAPMTSPALASFSAAGSSPNIRNSTSPSRGATASSTDTEAEMPSSSILERPVDSSCWASPRVNPPATEPTAWNSVAALTSDTKEKLEEASLDSTIQSISQGTAELAVSGNEQVNCPVKGDTAKPTKPKDNWLPPHLRTPDYAFRDPRIVKPNRSYLSRISTSEETPKENKEASTGGSATKPAAEVATAPAQEVTSPDGYHFHEMVLTPSSVNFQAVSPPTPTEGTKENREGQLYFSAWGKPERRLKAAAKVRKAIIKLPNPTPSLVASLLWGGIVEEIQIKTSSADVLFAYADDCQRYCDASANGIKYKKDGRDLVAFVDKGKDVDIVSGQLSSYLEQGFTRCVRAVDVLDKFAPGDLRMKAEFKNRKVEGIDIGKTEAGLRYVVFRFCSIAHAVGFKLALARDEEWDHCNIHHIADPCAQATGVHAEN